MTSSLRKAVYFSREELPLREWAENRPEGYSSYVKRLIAEDQTEERLRKNIIEVIEDYTESQAGRKALAQLAQELAKALGGKLILQTDLQEEVAQAADLLTEEIEQIAGFMTGHVNRI